MKKEIKNMVGFDKNDILIKLSPRINDSNKWDGTMSLSVISSQDNDLDKKDNDALQYLATLLCSTVPFMEDDEDFRDALVEYADDLNEKEIEDTLALKYDGNIVHVDFKNKH